jgi:hypothetical protein
VRRVAACDGHAQRLWNGCLAARAALIIRSRSCWPESVLVQSQQPGSVDGGSEQNRCAADD